MSAYQEAKVLMDKPIANLVSNLATLRTGRASPSVLDNISCEYYGDMMPINQIAAIKVPEPRQLLITPYDRNDVKSIVAAINASKLGINPVVDGVSIRLAFPAPTQERRVELTKKAKSYAEETKVVIRNIRRDMLADLKKEEGVSEGVIKNEENDIQKATDEYIAKIDKLLKEKNDEIMEI